MSKRRDSSAFNTTVFAPTSAKSNRIPRTPRVLGTDGEHTFTPTGRTWPADGVRATVERLTRAGETTLLRMRDHPTGVEVVGHGFQCLAHTIFNALNDGRTCRFCDQLVIGMSGEICLECAQREMKSPCRTCGKRVGRTVRDADLDSCEHPACKKRRLNPPAL